MAVLRTVCKDEHVHPTLLLAMRLIDIQKFQDLTKGPVLIQIPKDRFSHDMVHFPLL